MNKQTLGAAIAAYRKKNNMTQLELATKLNVSDKAVSKWERDLSCPDINTISQIAKIFDISVDELMQTNKKTVNKENIIALICKAVALAMSIAVIVLAILKEIDLYSGFTMLGISLGCISFLLLNNKG